MLKKIFSIIAIILTVLNANAYEDCIISSDDKLTDINVEGNGIINVFSLITIMNEKNTIIVHPLKAGQSSFDLLKGEKERIRFNVKVTEDSTYIAPVKGFEILTIDCPPDFFEYELDLPPGLIIYSKNTNEEE